jgi:hypothetical protein
VNPAGLPAEPDRLRVVAAVALGARTVEDGRAVTGLEPRVAWRLRRGGLGSTADGGVAVAVDAVKAAARAAAAEAEDVGAADPATAAVLRAFVRNGRLVSLPASRSKRLVVLEHLAMTFEPGVRYPEAEVDAILRAFHPDHAAPRGTWWTRASSAGSGAGTGGWAET